MYRQVGALDKHFHGNVNDFSITSILNFSVPIFYMLCKIFIQAENKCIRRVK